MNIIILPIVHYKDYETIIEFDQNLSTGITRYYMLFYKGLKHYDTNFFCYSSYEFNKRFSYDYFNGQNSFIYLNSVSNQITKLRVFLSIIRTVVTQKGLFLFDPLKIKESFIIFLFSLIFSYKRVAIVTDSPKFSFEHDRIRRLISNWFIRNSSALILVNKELKILTKSDNVATLIIESFVDEEDYIEPIFYSDSVKETIEILYAGEISPQNGIDNLITATNAQTNVILRLCGPVNESFLDVFKKSLMDKKIEYIGILNQKSLLEEMSRASLLINPRNNFYEYTKYSLPIKIPTYLASGVPVITTKLSGIPDIYNDYMITINSNSVENIQTAIEDFRDLTKSEKVEFGIKARRFILDRLSYKIQGKKVLDWIDQL